MSSQTYSLLWAQQSTLSQSTEHLHLVFSRIHTPAGGGLCHLCLTVSSKSNDVLNQCLGSLSHDQHDFDQCLIKCKSKVLEMKDFPHMLCFCINAKGFKKHS